jgi:site-specific DNA-methyltransferase (adenine-specific)
MPAEPRSSRKTASRRKPRGEAANVAAAVEESSRQYQTGEAVTTHRLELGDARELDWVADDSVHLVVTSPPYWTLKRYEDDPGQLGHVSDYETFHDELEKVWRHCYRALVSGGRLVCVVGDVCIARRRNQGRHMVMPLHADISVRCRRIGFDYLTPILWHKIANISYEIENGSSFLGKPFEPNAIIKNDTEYLLMLRKPGGYRKPTEEQRRRSKLSKTEHAKWFRAIWHDVSGTSTRDHPAPFSVELAYRLIRMFSFVEDTVLDPFAGTGSTMVGAIRAERNSIGVEVSPRYVRMARKRLEQEVAQAPMLSSRALLLAGPDTNPSRTALSRTG